MLAHLAGALAVRPVPGREVRLSGMVTLRPKGGLPLILERR